MADFASAYFVKTTPQKVEVDTADAATTPEKKKQANKDLQKTRLCVYHLEGKCGFGSSCTFAHYTSEVKSVPDLSKTQLCAKFAEGKCSNKNCTYAHGEEELRDSPNFKMKLCKWNLKGKCRNGTSCGFAHDGVELRGEAPPGFEGFQGVGFGPVGPTRSKICPPPPGLSLKGAIDDAATDVPSSQSLAESDLSMMSTASIPEEPIFRMMAGRGSAALQDQVATMGSAIGGLQAKLAALEDMMLQSQVAQMQQTINQLTEQCGAMEGALGAVEEDAGQEDVPMPIKPITRLNIKAIPFKPYTGCEDGENDSTKEYQRVVSKMFQ